MHSRPRSNWRAGALGALALCVAACGEPGPVVPVDLRLLDNEVETLSGGPVSVGPSYAGGQRRFAFKGAAPHAFRVSATVARGSRLRFALTAHGAADEPLPVSIVMRSRGGEETLFESTLAAGADAWSPHTVELELGRRPAVQEVELELRAGGEALVDSEVVVSWAGMFVEDTSVTRPNVLVVLIDTLNADHLGCYGYERETSPVIDRLAAEGVLFENAVSAAPWTDPSILAIFTGLYPSDLWNPEPHAATIRKTVPDGTVTLAEALAERGYHTVAASDHPGISAPRFGRGFDVYHHLFASEGQLDGWRQTPMRNVRNQLAELAADLPRSGVYLYLHLIYPHRPYDPPEYYREMFGPPAYGISPKNREGLINLYDAEIRRTDDLLGVILDDLDAAGFSDDRILALLSDHGEGFWEHGLHEHGNSLFNELLRVPFILHAPGRLPAGRRVHEAVSHVDLFPTLLELAEVPAPPGLRGTSLVPFTREGGAENRLLLSEFPHSSIVQARAIQSTTEKLILLGDGTRDAPAKYYDLVEDPDEKEDRAGSPELGERISGLRGVFPGRVDRSQSEAGDFEPPPEMVESLKALGYD